MQISKFEVTPRSDCCQERYAGVRLLVDGTTAAVTPVPNSELIKFDMISRGSTTGRFFPGSGFGSGFLVPDENPEFFGTFFCLRNIGK